MKYKTYSILFDRKDSEEYYSDIVSFTDDLMTEGMKCLGGIIDDYKKYILNFRLDEKRSDEEYMLELLSFGVLWRSYSKYALAVKYAPFKSLIFMGEYRKKHQKLKPYIDLVRGFVTTLLMLPESEYDRTTVPTLPQVDKLDVWLEATGEFREEALRFILWRAYWAFIPQEKLNYIFLQIRKFTDWFEKTSLERLGKYTLNVEDYNSRYNYRWREDLISCKRTRLEYHMNMAGAELLNRAYRGEYIETEVTSVLLPGCMRPDNGAGCKAVKEKKGLKCAGCNKECPVYEIRKKGIEDGYSVYIIPHASDLSLWSEKEGGHTRGVIASACVLNLVKGGLELKRYNIPAQCVILDYCGCAKHWFGEGVTTGLNLNELDRKLNKN